MGLRVNTNKTKFVSHASQLTVNRQQLPQDSLPFKCGWADSGTYLRKVFKHWDKAQDSTGNQLLRKAVSLAQVALVELEPLIRCQHWTRPVECFRFIHKYIFSRFAWFLPLVYPTEYNLRLLRVVQNWVILKCMSLCIPADLHFSDAMTVNMLRKRLVYCWLDSQRHYSGVHCLIIRKWGYLGHLVRRSHTHLARAALLGSLRDFKGGRAGLWKTHLHWLLECVDRFFPAGPVLHVCPQNLLIIEAKLSEWAVNRETWRQAGQKFLRDDLLPVHICSETKWTHWRSPLKLQMPWLVSAYVSRMNVRDSLGEYKAFFVDVEEGFMQYPIGPGLDAAVMARFVSYLSMLKPFCCLQLLMSQATLESHLLQLHDLHHHSLESHVVVMMEVVPVGWLRHVWALSQ